MVAIAASVFGAQAQSFDKQLDMELDFLTPTAVMPESPLSITPLFIGGIDSVATVDENGNPNGFATAKQWHDFIGVTEDTDNPGEFWVSINHEMILADDKIGDGGGMTVFKASEDADGDVTVLQQTIDGVATDFFNVEFKSIVGETGMNCGGIQSNDGRIWTAEEWFRSSTSSIYRDGEGVRDTMPWTISTDIPGNFDGQTIDKFQNFNWMVEIDPRTAKAIRKQYNWGRMGFEGGAVSNDNKTVYLGVDGSPAPWMKFVADTPGDFLNGDLFVFKASNAQGSRWIEVDNADLTTMLNLTDTAFSKGATMLNRVEWVTIDTTTGIVYFTETGRDNIGERWADELLGGAELAAHHIARGADVQGEDYADYYGRVMAFDPATEELSVVIEGGANNPLYDGQSSVGLQNYPNKHLSNPDGLSFMMIGAQPYLVICEDLNGTSFNRMPYGITNRACELYLLDLSINNPTPDDLIKITVGSNGSELTGAKATPSGRGLLLNVQHPNSSEMVNDYPYNNSLTLVISGFEGIVASNRPSFDEEKSFSVFPNPVSRDLHLNKVTDIAVYDELGQRVLVERGTDVVNIANLTPGIYVVVTKDDEAEKIVVE